MNRIDMVLAMDPETGTEEYREYLTDSLAEALTRAERDDAGQRRWIDGVLPEDYDIARAEGIAFNEADGLLI